MYKKTVLDNGLRIISHNMPDRQSLALGIWIRVGGRYESASEKGISHFLEHMVFKGTKKYSCRKLKESIEGVGGALNGFTSEELTCYLVKIPCRYLEMALDVLLDMVVKPVLPGLEIEKEKTVILEEIKMYKDHPQSYVYELLDELLWPKQPLGLPVIGSVESVSSLDRQQLKSFKQNYYTPSNIVISAAGFLEHKKLTQKITRSFSLQEKGQRHIFSEAKEKQDSPKFKLFYKDTEQTHIALGFHSFSRIHPLRHALGILHVVLGANMSSRLFNELREKRGLAYEIGTQVKRFQDTGSFLVHAGIDNRKVVDAIKYILKELKKTKQSLINPAEFNRAKEFYFGQLMLALEDTLDHMLWIGEYTVALDKAYSLKEIIAQVNKVSQQDVRRAAQAIFKENNLSLALIGPLKGAQDKIYKQLYL